LTARAILDAGRSQEALRRFVELREEIVDDPTNPSGMALLADIDRWIDRAFESCRTDRQPLPLITDSLASDNTAGQAVAAAVPQVSSVMSPVDGGDGAAGEHLRRVYAFTD
jgi:hypothetical protein